MGDASSYPHAHHIITGGYSFVLSVDDVDGSYTCIFSEEAYLVWGAANAHKIAAGAGTPQVFGIGNKEDVGVVTGISC